MGEKHISTLVDDIYKVLEGRGGWDAAITEYFKSCMEALAQERLEEAQEPRTNLGLSMLGTPCDRKIWYKINEPHEAEPLDGETIGNFLYGDIIEAFVLSLAKAAGHDVQYEQHPIMVHGVKGHCDAVIDGMVVDVKSCSSRAFPKFQEGKVPDDDPFGYVSQLSSYLYGMKDTPEVTYKTEAAFLAVRKERFKLALDRYDFTEELAAKEAEVERVKALVEGPIPQERLAPVPVSKTSKNMQVALGCRYCEYLKHCWPEARKFIYSAETDPKPMYLTYVDKLPRVPEETMR